MTDEGTAQLSRVRYAITGSERCVGGIRALILDDRTVAIADEQLGFPHAGQLRALRQHLIQCPAGVFDDIQAHGMAFDGIAVQQRLARKAALGQGQFPREIVRILKTGIHTLAADRRMQMRGVTSQEHASFSIGRHDAVADPVNRRPMQRREDRPFGQKRGHQSDDVL
jgi:hypothetical protein